ncbi:hypothetical protein SNEBB_002127 [Seison nebaliae]|nr:hypothetical protein SNEBB_002127 [Seison nebaliae]
MLSIRLYRKLPRCRSTFYLLYFFLFFIVANLIYIFFFNIDEEHITNIDDIEETNIRYENGAGSKNVIHKFDRKIWDNIEKKDNDGNQLKLWKYLMIPRTSRNFIKEQKEVVRMIEHAWKGYKKYAWNHDELKPNSKTYSTWFNLKLTIIESLDTLLISGFHKELEECYPILENFSFSSSNTHSNLFEVTIRIVGGLSSYHALISHVMENVEKENVKNYNTNIFNWKIVRRIEKILKDLLKRLDSAFATSPSPIPLSDVILKDGRAETPRWSTFSSTSEVSSLYLEWKYASTVTQTNYYENRLMKLQKHLHNILPTNKLAGLLPIYLNTRNGYFSGETITFGARGDSYYEYLIKLWIMNGSVKKYSPISNDLLNDYLLAMKSMKDHLWKITPNANLSFIGEDINKRFRPKMDHLVCFLAGNLQLAYWALGKGDNIRKILSAEQKKLVNSFPAMANNLTETCVEMSLIGETKLSPEIVYFDMESKEKKDDIIIHPADRHNLLRPETLESLYYLSKIGDKKKTVTYFNYVQSIMLGFQSASKIESGGYTSIGDVTNIMHMNSRDHMPSYFMAETLKYLYLIYTPEHLFPFDQWVFNTEGHPIPTK